ncbi:response regulator transcription factor [Chloroflexota bacterium]
MKALIVEDNSDIIEIVAQTFKLRWPEINLLSTSFGKEAVELVNKESPDIVMLDLGLPDIDGFQVLRQIRMFSDVPLVILTVRGEEEDKLRGFEQGADDYVVKPFSPSELVARLQAILRRGRICETAAKVVDHSSIDSKLRIDFDSQMVSLGGKLLKLSPREYELLCHLVTNEGKEVSNITLLEEVFPENKNDIRFLQVYMNSLINKLGENPDNPKSILDEAGTGYKFIS